MSAPEIKKILYATDLSDNARHAFNYAAIIAEKFGAQITVLHVIEELSTTGKNLIADFMGEDPWTKLKQERLHQFKNKVYQRLEAFCTEMSQQLQTCSFIVEQTILKEGNPASVIIEESKNDYDMIVIGTKGLGIIAGAIMGNTARRVVRHSAKPVVVIPVPNKK